LTNGNGVAVNADDIYVEILSSLHAHQAIITALSFTEPRILSSLQFRISERKFREMLEIVKPSITSHHLIILLIILKIIIRDNYSIY
jgi:hypothetical protein